MVAASFDQDLVLIETAAREAGRIALGYFRKDPQVWYKEGNSPVSEADLAVDLYLKEALLGARPDYGWLSEETDPALAEVASTRSPQRFFVVDPIDGTRSYIRGEDTWCVSIAVVEAGRPVAGVIDAPAKNEVFSAVAGGTARLNGALLQLAPRSHGGPLTVSMPDPMRRRLGTAILAGLSFERNAPSLAYRLALVAAGRLDGTLIRPEANDWDIAAGDLILERAGGALVDRAGELRLYKIAGRRHGLLIAAAGHALSNMVELAAAAAPELAPPVERG
ncbi:3'(2'),5'-bisphosphate nucleotidase CysQ [Aureimonas sp. SA4125]|uniref:3'(2'),5'-bisphosphate nucleotidase CysQ n=1 Tax=Aureimonas sp. SA4125 TaxID=2826993 RepID=UPI001CC521F4|nr:3'(2'),5'-bisphosphate nucleotidase CysQ [Aureimonas sp. SA4125]BDA82826.1 3'(2'),5'-bisphosphate nucleotidase CysQ [Aureimonas sp. SA4125]